MGSWLRVWGLGFWDLAEGLRLRVLGFDLRFGVWGLGILLRVLVFRVLRFELRSWDLA